MSESSDSQPAQPVAAAQLRSIVERVEALEEEKAARASDIREVYAEAKGNGFSVPALRAVVRRRKADRRALEELESMQAVYEAALGAAP